jgi:hypothetical protein
MTDDFHLLDLVSQAPAVQRILKSKPLHDKIAWLSARGQVTLIIPAGDDWPGRDTYRFTSCLGLTCAFFVVGDQFVFMGDNTTFTVTEHP